MGDDKDIRLTNSENLKSLSLAIGMSESQLESFLRNNNIWETSFPNHIPRDLCVYILELLDKKYQIELSWEEEIMEYYKKYSKLETIERIPRITIVGHVDAGKTTFIEQIIKHNLCSGEEGSITQNMIIYHANWRHKQLILIDSPGHDTFDNVRSMAIEYADIVLLFVSAADGMEKQTIKSLRYLREHHKQFITVITKSDVLSEQELEEFELNLANHNIDSYTYGGKDHVVAISSKKRRGFDKLISIIFELYKAPKIRMSGEGYGVILDCDYSKGMGFGGVSLIAEGEVKIKDNIITESGMFIKVKSIEDNVVLNGNNAGNIFTLPYTIHKIEKFYVINNSYEMKKIIEKIPTIHNKIEEDITEYEKQVIIKSNSFSIVKTIKGIIDNFDNSYRKIKVISMNVSPLSNSDILQLSDENTYLIDFGANIDSKLIKHNKIKVIKEKVIYRLMEKLDEKFKIPVIPVEVTKEFGHGIITRIFSFNKTFIFGGIVKDGSIVRNTYCKIMRGEDIITSGKIISLQNNKLNKDEITKGFEFAIVIHSPSDGKVKENDKIICVSRIVEE